MTKVCVVGGAGRMGTLLRSGIARSTDLRLSGVVVGSSAELSCGSWEGIAVSTAVGPALEGAELVLDFSAPAISAEVARCAADRKVPLLLGTTGHTAAQLAEIDQIPMTAPRLIAPNTSIGIFAMGELVKSARQILGPDFDVEVFELHHRHKVDAPSGTAQFLSAVCDSHLVPEDRSRGGERSPGSIGTASLRGGDVPGEHTVYFLGASERIEITHRVRDRAVFAEGALRLGRLLVGRPPGRYTVAELLR
ncbi:MAG: hypothetical protein RL417_1547 [Pseudomonadota bacterium]|jgi:4-hydroxy-tetrahydrodipicolinate reductase